MASILSDSDTFSCSANQKEVKIVWIKNSFLMSGQLIYGAKQYQNCQSSVEINCAHQVDCNLHPDCPQQFKQKEGSNFVELNY